MKMYKKIKEWKCRIFHKKVICEDINWFKFPTKIRLYGCYKCDLWMHVNDNE